MLLIVDLGILFEADFTAILIDTPPRPQRPPQPSPLLSASSSSPSSPYCTTVQPHAAGDAQLQFGRGAMTSPPPTSQSRPLIILSNTYCLCTGGHFDCSHRKSSLVTRWSHLESDPAAERVSRAASTMCTLISALFHPLYFDTRYTQS